MRRRMGGIWDAWANEACGGRVLQSVDSAECAVGGGVEKSSEIPHTTCDVWAGGAHLQEEEQDAGHALYSCVSAFGTPEWTP
jgi:hypothetical protein